MDILNTILARRSVRQYTAQPIPEDTLNAILYAGLAAASSKNRRPWEFVLVRDRAMLNALGSCRPGASNLLGKCTAAVVVCADAEAVDVWVEDCASAITQMHLAADAMGVGSCWLQVRLRRAEDGRDAADVVRELLGIPSRFGVMAILTLGMPESHPAPKAIDELLPEKIHREHF
ncbi:MAG: nitroreductase family protein [Clostridia bacterium]|nr:nitroreductase family protein [Clostridia bacterium]